MDQMTPYEKKASELAEKYAAKQNHTIVSALISEADFKAGFLAALDLVEVKGMEEALKFYSLSGRDKYGQLYNKVPSAEDKNRLVFGQVSIGAEAREALTAWRSFRGEK